MNRKEMLEKIEFIRRMWQDPIKLIMDLHTKTSIAFSSFIYCFLGRLWGLNHISSSSMSRFKFANYFWLYYFITLGQGWGYLNPSFNCCMDSKYYYWIC